MNRGRGIEVFDSLEKLKKLLKDYSSVGFDANNFSFYNSKEQVTKTSPKVAS
jgi:hypothetical protein